MTRVRSRLLDIAEAIERIEDEAKSGREAFDRDPKVQVWMFHHIQIIGEAVRAASDELRALEPSVPWAQIVAMRHILVHHYFGIDLDEVWSAVQNDIPPLKAAVESLLARLPEDDS